MRFRSVLRSVSVLWLLLAAALHGTSALGQQIDYGALEALFGEPVTVSATGKPQRASDAPATMEIITAERIARSGATDVPSLLRDLAGIDVYRITPNSPDVAIRGYAKPISGRLLVLVDGRQIYNDSFGFVSWGLLPVEIDSIRQIEVIKGPQSALYGFNAGAGVINIITRDPLKDPDNFARVRIGSANRREASTAVTTKLGESSALRLSAGGFAERRGLTLNPNALSPLPPRAPERRAVNADAVSELPDGGRLGLTLNYVAGAEQREHWGFSPIDLREEVASVRGSFSRETALGLITAQVYHNYFTLEADVEDFQQTPVRNSATVASLQDLFKVSADDSVRLSLEYRRNVSSVAGYPDSSLFYQVFSAGGMWDRALSESLSLTNALRLDHLRLGNSGSARFDVPLTDDDFHRTLTSYSFNSGLVWRATDADTLRLTAGRGLNLPNLAELGALQLRSAKTFLLSYGNPRLEPAEVWNGELSWDRTLHSLDGGFRGSLFWQRNTNLIDFNRDFTLSPLTGAPRLQQVNYGASRTVGLELGLTGHVAPAWSWQANYTFQDIEDKMPERAVLIYPGAGYAKNTPQHKINLRAGWTQDPWEADLGLHWLSHYSLPDVSPWSAGQTRARAELGDIVILEPRLALKVSEGVTAEVVAQGLWDRREMPLAAVDRRVLFSVIGRW